jgi:CBS domain containing-hemolysin-like protein
LVIALSFLFVVLNGVFVAAEFALIATPRASLEHKAAQGNRTAKRILNVLESSAKQDRYIATAQLGITLASLALGMYGEHALSDLLEPTLGEIPILGAAALAGLISLSALTVAHIVIGEMVPKGLALQRPELVTRLTMWPMRVLLVTLYPFVHVSSAIARAILKLVGITRQAEAHGQSYSPEELQLIVAESEEGGAMKAESGRILREMFEFDELTASQAMVPRVRIVGLPVGATPDQMREVVRSHRHTRYPVYDGDLDHILGMVHVKDLLRRLLQNEPIVASEVRRLPVVPETTRLDDVLTQMQRTNAHLAVVIDEHGGTAGLISLEDLFEEVVGELDEGVPTSPSIAPLGDGRVRAAGTLRLDELGQYFDLDVTHPEVDSVSGLVLAILDRPPVVGDVIEYQRLTIEVTATQGRGVRDAIATLLPAPADE